MKFFSVMMISALLCGGSVYSVGLSKDDQIVYSHKTKSKLGKKKLQESELAHGYDHGFNDAKRDKRRSNYKPIYPNESGYLIDYDLGWLNGGGE